MAETRYHNVSLDSDHDITDDALTVSLTADRAVSVTAERVAAPPTAADLTPPAEGFTRYWWRVLVGPGQPLDPAGKPEPLTLYGRLVDTPEVLEPTWVVGEAQPDVPPPLTADCWPVVVPPGSAAEWAALPGEARAYAEALAVSVLRTLTAGVVGGCPVTVRPCRSGCPTTGTWATYPVTGGGPGRGSVYPVLDTGTWYNVGCSRGCGVCVARNVVPLPGHPSEVTEVRVDGAALEPSAYYLTGRYLVRADGTPWPTRNSMTARLTDPGVFAVTYYQGARVDGLGALAAGALAVEFARAGAGGRCRLPARAKSVARSGVSIELAAVGEMFDSGITGVTEADAYVARVNPHRLKVRPVVWSPDLASR